MSVRLREVTADDIPLLDLWDSTPAYRGEFNDFGLPRTPHAEQMKKGFIDSMHGKLIIETQAGEPIGTIDWRPAMYGPPPESMAYQLGITLAPEARGKGYGSDALVAIADYLFEHTTVNRVEGSCDVENIASQRAFAKAGYRLEGTNRGSQFRAGAYHDLMMFAKLRGEV
jgi:RimJ/RimL family protein N-acetyltransferase